MIRLLVLTGMIFLLWAPALVLGFASAGRCDPEGCDTNGVKLSFGVSFAGGWEVGYGSQTAAHATFEQD